jgi:hypothetical protein
VNDGPGAPPWRAASTGELVLLAVGSAAVAVGWAGASGAPVVGGQLRWVNVAVCGFVVAGVACAMHVITGARAVRERRGLVLEQLASLGAPVPSAAEVVTALVASPTMRLYHLASCPLAHGKATTAAPVDEHRGAGRRPCGVCRP